MERRTGRVRATDTKQNGGLSQAGKSKKKQWKLMRGKGENRRRQEMVDSKIETTNFQ